MGSYLSCVSADPSSATTHDMSVVRNKNLPFIWITGPPNSGKKTMGRLIRNKYEFEYINITDLLRQESSKDTKNATIIKRQINANRKVPDAIVIDVVKEALISSTNDKGFLICNFPKTVKQAEMFTREIGNVNFVFYLYTGFPVLIDRAQRRSSVPLDHDALRRNIALAAREIKACLGNFAVKIESINTSGLPEETFPKIETALIRRINISRPIVAETDYVQPQQFQPNGQCQSTPFTETCSDREETNNIEEEQNKEDLCDEDQPPVQQNDRVDEAATEIDKEDEPKEMNKDENNENKIKIDEINDIVNLNENTKDENTEDENDSNDKEKEKDVEEGDIENEKEIKLTEFSQEVPTADETIVSLNRN